MEEENPLALICIQSTKQTEMNLRRVAQRIRYQVRGSDAVVLLKNVCAIVLPVTPLEGAQAVARRLAPLLTDIEYEVQILCEGAAQLALLSLQDDPECITVEREHGSFAQLRAIRGSHLLHMLSENQRQQPDDQSIGSCQPDLPYLAFLGNYPALRLLHLLPYDLACRYRCVPVGAERRSMTLATCQRLAYPILVQFQTLTRCEIFQVRCDADMIDDFLLYWRHCLLPMADDPITLVSTNGAE